jgi:putative PIN family toxin of toxin-antitoxin system
VPRAVLDPNVLVSALISPDGPSAGLLVEHRAGAFELVVSPRLLDELGDVLGREKFRRYVAATEVEEYLALLRREALLFEDPKPSGEALCDDPDDEYLIALARTAQVNALVSGDSHLLELVDLIPVLTPREFLESLANP